MAQSSPKADADTPQGNCHATRPHRWGIYLAPRHKKRVSSMCGTEVSNTEYLLYFLVVSGWYKL